MLAASGENCETGFSIKFLPKKLAKQQNEVRWKLRKHIGETELFMPVRIFLKIPYTAVFAFAHFEFHQLSLHNL